MAEPNRAMAWEWTRTLGLAGMFFTWLTAKQGRDHERLLAAEAREQQRLEKTYIDLLDMVQRAGQWVQFVYPMVDVGQPQPALPTLEEQAHIEAVVGAFGSD
jgi:hypothetical protein